MDRTKLMEMTSLLDCLEQPVFFVEKNLIIFCNRAASAMGLQAGMEVLPLLGRTADLYLASPSDGGMVLELSLDGRTYTTTAHWIDGVDVFCVQLSSATDPMGTDTMSSIAQTIRQPLSTLFATASGLFSYLEEREDPKIQRQTAVLNRSFYQLLRIAGNLTDSSQLLAGETVFYGEDTDLRSFFADLAAKVKPLCEVAGLQFEFACPGRSFSGVVDRQKLERAVLNLISNAMKYTPQGGKIRLQVDLTRNQAIIKVIDNGEGMEAGLLTTAFTRYGHRNYAGDPRWGVGLGLPLARKIAELHGGTVIIQTQPGEGTTVTMSLSLRSKEDPCILSTPIVNYDYAGGYSHVMVELSDVLPVELFDSLNLG